MDSNSSKKITESSQFNNSINTFYHYNKPAVNKHNITLDK